MYELSEAGGWIPFSFGQLQSAELTELLYNQWSKYDAVLCLTKDNPLVKSTVHETILTRLGMRGNRPCPIKADETLFMDNKGYRLSERGAQRLLGDFFMEKIEALEETEKTLGIKIINRDGFPWINLFLSGRKNSQKEQLAILERETKQKEALILEMQSEAVNKNQEIAQKDLVLSQKDQELESVRLEKDQLAAKDKEQNTIIT